MHLCLPIVIGTMEKQEDTSKCTYSWWLACSPDLLLHCSTPAIQLTTVNQGILLNTRSCSGRAVQCVPPLERCFQTVDRASIFVP
jgi:hypothetical protein